MPVPPFFWKKNNRWHQLCAIVYRFSIFQAGGHTQLVSIGSGLVSKPVNEREALFYKQKSKLIEPFLPKFEGKPSFSRYEE